METLKSIWHKIKIVLSVLICIAITVSFFLGAMPIGGVGYILGIISVLLFTKFIR